MRIHRLLGKLFIASILLYWPFLIYTAVTTFNVGWALCAVYSYSLFAYLLGLYDGYIDGCETGRSRERLISSIYLGRFSREEAKEEVPCLPGNGNLQPEVNMYTVQGNRHQEETKSAV